MFRSTEDVYNSIDGAVDGSRMIRFMISSVHDGFGPCLGSVVILSSSRPAIFEIVYPYPIRILEFLSDTAGYSYGRTLF